MRYLLVLLGLLAVVQGLYNYGVDPKTFIKRQDPSIFLTGSHNPDGSMGVRREIRDLEKDTKVWNLYLLGLDMMQWTDQSQRESWYQLMGIHGRPYLPFDNVQATPGNDQSGYCTHISILFPTWHRPYLALYEQVLYGLVHFIARLWPNDEYFAAAARFRIPYWDWAMVQGPGQRVFPARVQSPMIIVEGPSGPQEISNPLFSYIFDPLNPSDLPDPPFNKFPQTVRYPTTQDSSAVSQNGLVADQLDNNAASMRGRLNNIFSNYHDYAQVSNEAWIPKPNPSLNNYDSIESIHDAVHGLVGNGGHMSVISYASFDPIFMLHHTMVDRIFSMWQILNPTVYVTPDTANMDTFTTSEGDIQDRKTPLTPFRHSQRFWNSDDVRGTEVFGYTYPETINSTRQRDRVITSINTLYGNAIVSKRYDVGEHYEWLANIRLQKHALDVPFFIHLFIGSFDRNPVLWSFEPNLVASQPVFLKSNATGAVFISSSIPLTSTLMEKIEEGLLKSLDPADVNPFLADNFQYRLSGTDDTEISNERVPSLSISLASAPVEHASAMNRLPVWGDLVSHVDITTSGNVS